MTDPFPDEVVLASSTLDGFANPFRVPIFQHLREKELPDFRVRGILRQIVTLIGVFFEIEELGLVSVVIAKFPLLTADHPSDPPLIEAVLGEGDVFPRRFGINYKIHSASPARTG